MKSEKAENLPEPPPRRIIRQEKSITTPSSTSDEKLEKSVNNLQSPQSQESVGASNEITESEDSAAKKSDKTETSKTPKTTEGASTSSAENNVTVVQSSQAESESGRIESLENELKIAKEMIQSLKMERRKLRADKNDLLQQVKQLCSSLQDKEQELRNFIRKFDQKLRENENSSARASSSDSEHDRMTLMKHAQEEAERSIALAAQLNVKELQIKRMEQQLMDARRQLSKYSPDPENISINHNQVGIMNHGCEEGDPSRGVLDPRMSEREAMTDFLLGEGENDCIVIDSDSISLVSNQMHMGSYKDYSPSISPTPYNAMHHDQVDRQSQERNYADLETSSAVGLRQGIKGKQFSTLTGRSKAGAWGSISRVFARSRNRNKGIVQSNDEFQWSNVSEESYNEKIKILREASEIPMVLWRNSHIAAWLEIGLNLPRESIRSCLENVKSGKVLLELMDSDIESALGLKNPMHRKKLRLAIEEHKRPMTRNQFMSQLGHTWCGLEWLHELGLSQYSENFMNCLVDARMLDTLTKKELEKYLGVTKKFHQASIVHGINLLRMMRYDRQTLAMRRLESENEICDPMVWTNQRCIRWIRSIDLGEFAENLRSSGIHGALLVLEQSFSGDTLASCLGIPASKHIVRKHLNSEFDNLILPARKKLRYGIRNSYVSNYDRYGNNIQNSTLPKNNYYLNGKSPTHSFSSNEGGSSGFPPTSMKHHDDGNHNRYSVPLAFHSEDSERNEIYRKSAPEFMTDN